ncbi:hypothetical protein Taro_051568 [Colocasia esculenta]|uniref:EF-hand domain-containing protein n=1 Tax=Colocasia esculenta TaxID=4460 RepID=A0A843XH57_COLES|nr:hypothetical protein [Colocasia esculenta]
MCPTARPQRGIDLLRSRPPSTSPPSTAPFPPLPTRTPDADAAVLPLIFHPTHSNSIQRTPSPPKLSPMAPCPHLSFLESPPHPLFKAAYVLPTSPHCILVSGFLSSLCSSPLYPHQLSLPFLGIPICSNERRRSPDNWVVAKFATFSPWNMAKNRQGDYFEDYLPVMAERLGGQALVDELCVGFQLLADPSRGLITFDSLKRNAAALGLGGMTDEELRGMLQEGDSDGDGALDQMEFCVLMFRLSPELMAESRRVAGEALRYDLTANRRGFFS